MPGSHTAPALSCLCGIFIPSFKMGLLSQAKAMALRADFSSLLDIFAVNLLFFIRLGIQEQIRLYLFNPIMHRGCQIDTNYS